MADRSSRSEIPLDMDRIQEDPSMRTTEEGNSNVLNLVKSIFADPEALQLLRSAFTNPSEEATKVLNGSNSEASKAPHIEPEVQIINAGATKTQIPARTNDQSVSDEAANSQTAAKRPRLNATQRQINSMKLMNLTRNWLRLPHAGRQARN